MDAEGKREVRSIMQRITLMRSRIEDEARKIKSAERTLHDAWSKPLSEVEALKRRAEETGKSSARAIAAMTEEINRLETTARAIEEASS